MVIRHSSLLLFYGFYGRNRRNLVVLAKLDKLKELTGQFVDGNRYPRTLFRGDHQGISRLADGEVGYYAILADLDELEALPAGVRQILKFEGVPFYP
jgi:hypothetical protein